MDCRDSKRTIYQMLDGEAPGVVKAELALHAEGCSTCRGELKLIKAFHGVLKSDPARIEPSKDFERVFWQKILERSAIKAPADSSFGEQNEPWFTKLLKELDSLIPHPGMPQMAMVVLMAFLVGGTGGVVSARGSTGSFEAERNSIQYLSGFHEFKGIPSSSVAASYLKAIDDRSAA